MSYPQQFFQNHIAIIVGPPKIKEIEDNAKDWLCTPGSPFEDAWFEHVANTVYITSMPEPEDETIIESFMSHALGQKVKVKPLTVAKNYRGEQTLPAIYIYEKYITDVHGESIPIENYTKDVREMFGNYFHEMLKSQWIHVSSTVSPL